MDELRNPKSIFSALAGALALNGRQEVCTVKPGLAKVWSSSALSWHWACQVVQRSPYSLRDNEILGRVVLIQGAASHRGYLPSSGAGGVCVP